MGPTRSGPSSTARVNESPAAPSSASCASWDSRAHGGAGSGSAPPSATRPSTARPTWSSASFAADAPNRLWVADLTYVKTHTGWVYVAFVIDVFSRFVVGWQSLDLACDQDLALDALEMAIYARKRPGLDGLVHHSDRGVQYLVHSLHRAARRGRHRRVGRSGGDSYDNALAESFNGLYKTELIHRRGTVAQRRARRMGHPHLRRLVQQPAHPQRDRQDPTGRTRGRPTTVRTQHEKQCLHRQLSL